MHSCSRLRRCCIRDNPREWDARGYDALPLPHERWGARTIGRLATAGLRLIVDAGAGTGRDTALLLDAVPSGRIIAIDGSAAMLQQLRSRLGARAARVGIVQADLREPLPLRVPADAIFSVAAFHWITDHRSLFGHLARALIPGGQLVTECGGQGNLARVNPAIEAVLGKSPGIWNFAGVAETREELAAAGFTRIEVALREVEARFEAGDQLHRYLKSVVLGTHLQRVAPERHDELVAQIAARLGEPVIDYVRLEIGAVKG